MIPRTTGAAGANASILFSRLEPLDFLEFDRVTSLAARMAGVPVSLVSLVEETRQVFPGACGLGLPWCDSRSTPLSHSFCKTVVETRSIVVVTDARKDVRFRENPAVKDLGVVAYLGIPLIDSSGQALGAFCLIDSSPRFWTDSELQIARDFASVATTLLDFCQEKLRNQSLLDVLSHDLKTPLSAISFSARLLAEQQDALPENLSILTESILEASESAFTLLEGIKTRRSSPACGSSCDLIEVADSVVSRLQPLAMEKEIDLACEVASGLVSAQVDSWTVERVLENLLTNAIKFSPVQGKVVVGTCGEEDLVGLVVSDSGPGFSKEDLAYLFQRYTRLSADPTRGEPSSGLGLSIAKRLMTQSGGRIELVSKPGQSAVFEVLFPRCR